MPIDLLRSRRLAVSVRKLNVFVVRDDLVNSD